MSPASGVLSGIKSAAWVVGAAAAAATAAAAGSLGLESVVAVLGSGLLDISAACASGCFVLGGRSGALFSTGGL